MKQNRWYRAGGILSLVCALVMAAVAVQAQTLQPQALPSLADLISNNTVLQNGDKQFGNWFFDVNNAALLDPSQIHVRLIQDAAGNYGLEFLGAFQASGNTALDFHVGFSVTVDANSQNQISDVHLYTDAVQLAGDGSYVAVTESIYPGTSATPPPLLSIGDSTSTSGETLVAQGDVFPTQKSVYVLKDITVVAGNGTGLITSRIQNSNYAVFSTLDQTFSQIPEPGTIVLVATALFGLCLTGRRNRK